MPDVSKSSAQLSESVDAWRLSLFLKVVDVYAAVVMGASTRDKQVGAQGAKCELVLVIGFQRQALRIFPALSFINVQLLALDDDKLPEIQEIHAEHGFLLWNAAYQFVLDLVRVLYANIPDLHCCV